MKLGYGTYGMPKLTVIEAIEAAARIGYDGVELAVIPNHPAAPERLDRAARQAVRARLADLGLELPALMLGLNSAAADQRPVLDELARCGELAHDLAPDRPPVLVTTAGGSAKRWEEDKNLVAEHIAAWARQAAKMGLVLALEPHVGGVVHRPEHAEWIRARAGLDNLKFNYDHSHFVLQGIPPEQAAPIMAPHAVATHLKDAVGDPDHVTFLLPGETEFDYPAFFRLLHDLGYDGYLTVEVSGMIWNRDDYDPLSAAEFSFRTLSEARRRAGLA